MRLTLPLSLVAIAFAIPNPAILSAQRHPESPELKTVRVAEDVELHYLDVGKGDPVIFIHGGLTDYSMWENQVRLFAEKYRTIVYSRQYNHPNTSSVQPNYSPDVDAGDLAALLKKLGVGKAHIVGSSLGGRVALFFAVRHPELVRSLVLQEAPVQFAGDPPNEARAQTQKALRLALEQGNREEILQRVLDTITGGQAKFENLPPNARQRMRTNLPEFEAYLRNERDTELDRNVVRTITAPTLLISGEKSPPTIWKPVEKELLRLLPQACST